MLEPRPRRSVILIALLGSSFLPTNLRGQQAGDGPSVELPEAVLARAIAAGSEAGSPARYLERAGRELQCSIAGYMSMDGIEKKVLFLSDFDRIALAAASAKMELRTFGLIEAKQLPVTGTLLAEARLAARGAFPMERLQKKYSATGTHLVLIVGDSVVQPIDKSGTSTSAAGRPSTLTLWQRYPVAGSNVYVGTPVGGQHLEFRQSFVFPVAAADLPDKFGIVLVNGAGEKKSGECRVPALRSRELVLTGHGPRQ